MGDHPQDAVLLKFHLDSFLSNSNIMHHVHSLVLQIRCEARCLGTQNSLPNHLEKGAVSMRVSPKETSISFRKQEDLSHLDLDLILRVEVRCIRRARKKMTAGKESVRNVGNDKRAPGCLEYTAGYISQLHVYIYTYIYILIYIYSGIKIENQYNGMSRVFCGSCVFFMKLDDT